MLTFLSKLENTPDWAKDWCYFYMFASITSALTAFLTLIIVILGFNEFYKKGRLSILCLYLFVIIFQTINSMVTFWMCRRSLK